MEGNNEGHGHEGMKRLDYDIRTQTYIDQVNNQLKGTNSQRVSLGESNDEPVRTGWDELRD